MLSSDPPQPKRQSVAVFISLKLKEKIKISKPTNEVSWLKSVDIENMQKNKKISKCLHFFDAAISKSFKTFFSGSWLFFFLLLINIIIISLPTLLKNVIMLTFCRKFILPCILSEKRDEAYKTVIQGNSLFQNIYIYFLTEQKQIKSLFLVA